MASRTQNIRYVLGSILAFGALNAVAGGYYGLSGAADVPREWLGGTPFTDYLVPSLFLLVVVGGAMLWAAAAVFGNWRRRRSVALGAAGLVLCWIAVQVAMIGYVSWMQPTTAFAAALAGTLAWFLPRR